MGILGCVLCIVGSTVIVLHAPAEHSISSVEEIWDLATQPGESCNLVKHCKETEMIVYRKPETLDKCMMG